MHWMSGGSAVAEQQVQFSGNHICNKNQNLVFFALFCFAQHDYLWKCDLGEIEHFFPALQLTFLFLFVCLTIEWKKKKKRRRRRRRSMSEWKRLMNAHFRYHRVSFAICHWFTLPIVYHGYEHWTEWASGHTRRKCNVGLNRWIQATQNRPVDQLAGAWTRRQDAYRSYFGRQQGRSVRLFYAHKKYLFVKWPQVSPSPHTHTDIDLFVPVIHLRLERAWVFLIWSPELSKKNVERFIIQ